MLAVPHVHIVLSSVPLLCSLPSTAALPSGDRWGYHIVTFLLLCQPPARGLEEPTREQWHSQQDPSVCLASCNASWHCRADYLLKMPLAKKKWDGRVLAMHHPFLSVRDGGYNPYECRKEFGVECVVVSWLIQTKATVSGSDYLNNEILSKLLQSS